MSTKEALPAAGWTARVLQDRFEIRRALARGGMGAVYVAWDPQFEVEVAVKVLDLMGHTEISDEHRRRFESEAKVLARLRSPHIVRPLAWGRTEDQHLFLVTELLAGESLQERLDRAGHLPLNEALKWLKDACRGLSEAHAAGVIHRDLKPGNLFIERATDGEERLKLLDFGVAKVTTEATPVTQEGSVLGTVAYMAPEQAQGDPVDARADLYSLGVVAYRMLTGATPFSGQAASVMLAHVRTPPPRFREQAIPVDSIPEPVEALVMELLAKRPNERPVSAAALLARLEAVMDIRDTVEPTAQRRPVGQPIESEVWEVPHALDETPSGPVPPVTWPEPESEAISFGPPPKPRSRPAWVRLGAGVLMVGCVALGGWLWLERASGPTIEIKSLQPPGDAVEEKARLPSTPGASGMAGRKLASKDEGLHLASSESPDAAEAAEAASVERRGARAKPQTPGRPAFKLDRVHAEKPVGLAETRATQAAVEAMKKALQRCARPGGPDAQLVFTVLPGNRLDGRAEPDTSKTRSWVQCALRAAKRHEWAVTGATGLLRFRVAPN